MRSGSGCSSGLISRTRTQCGGSSVRSNQRQEVKSAQSSVQPEGLWFKRISWYDWPFDHQGCNLLRVNIRKYLTAKSSKPWPSLRSWTAARKTSIMESDLQIFMKQNSVALHHLSHYITHLTACSVLYPSLPSSLACASVWLVLQRWSSWAPTQLFSISSQWDPLIFSLQRFCIHVVATGTCRSAGFGVNAAWSHKWMSVTCAGWTLNDG